MLLILYPQRPSSASLVASTRNIQHQIIFMIFKIKIQDATKHKSQSHLPIFRDPRHAYNKENEDGYCHYDMMNQYGTLLSTGSLRLEQWNNASCSEITVNSLELQVKHEAKLFQYYAYAHSLVLKLLKTDWRNVKIHPTRFSTLYCLH
jgi:hypothetical protein